MCVKITLSLTNLGEKKLTLLLHDFAVTSHVQYMYIQICVYVYVKTLIQYFSKQYME